jgi:hypothetical protein
LLACNTVDAVYVPLPTAVRKAWLIRAAAAGKHVLSEKPVAANLRDAEEVLAACRRNGVQFMDGVMFMHTSPTTCSTWRRLAVREYSNSDPNSQEANMFRNFAALHFR